jgi:hypothetical protein
MIDLTKEGKQFIVFVKDGSNTYQTAFQNWEETEKFIAVSSGVHKIVSMECYDIPLTGLTLAVP